MLPLVLGVVNLVRANAARTRPAVPGHRSAVAERAVQDVLAVIPTDVRVRHVRAGQLGEELTGVFHCATRDIMFDDEAIHDESDVVEIAAHECVHALIQELYPHEPPVPPEARLKRIVITETTAYVLGARLAGRVLAARGLDGERFAREFLASYRLRCEWSEWTMRNGRLVLRAAGESRGFSRGRTETPPRTHFPCPEVVDEVARICSPHRDPRSAVDAVVREFDLWNEAGPTVPRSGSRPST